MVVVEKNEAFHHTWNFPRYSAIAPNPSHTKRAFIPYGGFLKGAPKGVVEWIHGEVTTVARSGDGDGVRGYVQLKTDQAIPFTHLVVAVGTSGWKLQATSTEEARADLRRNATRVQAVQRIVVIGRGAVGVELSTDIKTCYPEKDVTLIHSRNQLLNRFGLKLHEVVMKRSEDIGMRVILGQRAEPVGDEVKGEPGALSLPKSGEEIPYDLLFRCMGGNSLSSTEPLRLFLPSSALTPDGRIRTADTLQVKDAPYVFAVGDVCEPEVAPGVEVAQIGRAAFAQVAVAIPNMVKVIEEGEKATGLRQYWPNEILENGIKLTLGLDRVCMYMTDNGREYTFSGRGPGLDLGVRQAWWKYSGGRYPAIE